jgi:hypothetical protein
VALVPLGGSNCYYLLFPEHEENRKRIKAGPSSELRRRRVSARRRAPPFSLDCLESWSRSSQNRRKSPRRGGARVVFRIGGDSRPECRTLLTCRHCCWVSPLQSAVERWSAPRCIQRPHPANLRERSTVCSGRTGRRRSVPFTRLQRPVSRHFDLPGCRCRIRSATLVAKQGWKTRAVN